MDKSYFEYIEKFEDFIIKNHDLMGSVLSYNNIGPDTYLRHFGERSRAKNKVFLNYGMPNLYDDRLIRRYKDRIVYFYHSIPDNSGPRKFVFALQVEENFHILGQYGFTENTFLTALEIFTDDSKQVVEFIKKNKDIEFKKDADLGFKMR